MNIPVETLGGIGTHHDSNTLIDSKPRNMH